MSSDLLGVGHVLGRYRLQRSLGHGGMGQVFEATDLSLHRLVAVKVISPLLAEDPEFRRRFLREARAMAALDSPHVVQVFHQGEDGGHLFMVTQLVPGGDLGRRLRERGTPSREVAVDLVGQVAAGLADVHAAGLVHRDVKPANVLVRERGAGVRALLADFGVAAVPGEGHAADGGPTAIAGTPTYMAPELHTGAPATPASDVYSLGCLLWTALAGRPPYTGVTDFETVRAHREQPVPQLSGGGAREVALNRVLRTALAKEPADRYPTGAELRDALAAVAATPDVGPEAPHRPGRRRWTAAVAVLAATLVAVGWWAVRDPGSGPGLTRAGLDHAVVRWATSLGFGEVAARCPSGVRPGAAAHCAVRADGRRGWVRARLEEGGPVFEPELPPGVVEREIGALLLQRGLDGTPRCRGHLRGTPGAELTCRVPGSRAVGQVEAVVTRVRDLEVSFDLRAVPR